MLRAHNGRCGPSRLFDRLLKNVLNGFREGDFHALRKRSRFGDTFLQFADHPRKGRWLKNGADDVGRLLQQPEQQMFWFDAVAAQFRQGPSRKEQGTT